MTSILKLSDYLSRSLRENVELFDLDGDEVTYVTEGGEIIKGLFSIQGQAVKLDKIEVTSADLFLKDEKFDKFVNSKSTQFLKSLNENDYQKVNVSFEDLLSLWEKRLLFDKVTEKLARKRQKFNDSTAILSQPEAMKLNEISQDLVGFLIENREKIINISEIKNSVKLLNVLSTAFNFPRVTATELAETGEYKIEGGLNESIYEIICRQELIRKELLESQENFDGAWATNAVISELAQCVYEKDDTIVLTKLVEAFKEVPYIALAAKKSLTKAFTQSLSLNDIETIPLKDIKSFSSRVYEAKKPLKEYIIKTLNEQYGINIQNLKDIPSFKDLVKTQIVIFETLGKISPKDSIQAQVLLDMSKMLSNKSGAESLDVNNHIHALFEAAGYTELLTEMNLMDFIDFDRVAQDLGAIGNILKMIKAQGDPGMQQGGMGQEMGGQQMQQPGMPQQGMPQGMEQGMPQPGMDPQMQDQDQLGSEEMLDPALPNPGMAGEEEGEFAEGDEDLDDPSMDSEQAAMEADAEMGGEEGIPGEEEEMIPGEEEEMMGGEEGIPGEEEEMMGEEEPIEVGKEELLQNLSKLDALIQDLAAELGDEGMEGGEGFEGEEEEFGEEGEEEIPGEEGSEEFGGEEEVPEEEEEGNPFDKKKKKKKPFPPRE